MRFAVVDDAYSPVKSHVAYVYFCDGAYLTDAAAVRRRLANAPRGRRYYAKLELATRGSTKEWSLEVMNEFLPVVLEEFERGMPGG
jgi:hypothetical protein